MFEKYTIEEMQAMDVEQRFCAEQLNMWAEIVEKATPLRKDGKDPRVVYWTAMPMPSKIGERYTKLRWGEDVQEQ